MTDVESTSSKRRAVEIGLLCTAAAAVLSIVVFSGFSKTELERETRPADPKVLVGKEIQEGAKSVELQERIPSFGPPEVHGYAPVIPLDDPKIDVCTTEIGKPLCPLLYFLGAQKAGSTSLWVWAKEHWRFLTFPSKSTAGKVGTGKEVHFFDWKWGGGTDYYYSFYPTRKSKSEVSVDLTPDYIRYSIVPARLKQTIGDNDVRFILVVRDPVRRAYSWFRHIMRGASIRKRFVATFRAFGFDFRTLSRITADLLAECVKEHEGAGVFDGCAQDSLYWFGKEVKVPATGQKAVFLGNATQLFSDGMYGDILLHWYRYFPADQFCIAVLERMAADFPAELRRLEPCVRSMAGQFDAPGDANELRQVNSKSKCLGCMSDEDPAFKKVGRMLCEKLYSRANALFRLVLLEKCGWDAAHLPMWEERYLS